MIIPKSSPCMTIAAFPCMTAAWEVFVVTQAEETCLSVPIMQFAGYIEPSVAYVCFAVFDTVGLW